LEFFRDLGDEDGEETGDGTERSKKEEGMLTPDFTNCNCNSEKMDSAFPEVEESNPKRPEEEDLLKI
jgi:hypothetical protein